MIIESGVIIFAGLLLLFIKLSPVSRLKLLGHPLALDLTVTVLAFLMHYGTFSGVMAAAVAGLMCSGFTSLGRKWIGYISGGVYVPGWVTLDVKYPQQLEAKPKRDWRFWRRNRCMEVM